MKLLVWLALVSVAPAFGTPATLSLSHLFTPGAVLQRDVPAPVWGRATPGALVSVSLGASRVDADADADGRWKVVLPAQPANADDQTLTVTSLRETQTVPRVVVGDVWLCSGQSNMEFGFGMMEGHQAELADLSPAIRLFRMPHVAAGSPRTDAPGVWTSVTPETLTKGGWNGFSAVAYTFGRRLQRELNVPIGLIQVAWGGSPISTWIPVDAWGSNPRWKVYQDQIAAADQAWHEKLAADPQAKHPFETPAAAKDLGPSALFQGMIEPFVPLALKGFLWYQGEADAGDPKAYTPKMAALISGWRQAFGQGPLPFYFVQIAPWKGYGTGDRLPQLWSAQEAALATPGTGWALTMDVGDPDNIHPTNKEPVGNRLALQALVKTYHRSDLHADGPVFGAWDPSTKTVGLQVNGSLQTTDEQPPRGFEVRGPDGRWLPAEGILTPSGVVLSVDGVTGVRYGWSGVPSVNLTDGTDLPTRPFQWAP